MTEDRIPFDRALPGHGISPLPDGWTAVSSFHLIKCLDDEGDPSWVFRTSEAMNLEELLGALTVQVETLKPRLVRAWEDPDED